MLYDYSALMISQTCVLMWTYSAEGAVCPHHNARAFAAAGHILLEQSSIATDFGGR